MPATLKQAIQVISENPELICHMTLSEYVSFCCTGRLPVRIAKIFQTQSFLRDILCAADIVGALEPLSATRPGVCDPAIEYERDITVAAATLNPDGSVTPTEERVISFCAPLNRTLVVKKSRVTPTNEAAQNQPVPQPVYKKVNLGTFGEWCLPFEPTSAPGSFVNIEHIIVPPGAGFSIYVQNHLTTGPATYHYEAQMWSSC